MTQQAQYPDPEQLRAWAHEPMPFHTIQASDLELIEDSFIRVEYGMVGEDGTSIGTTEYRYRPGDINVEVDVGDYVSIEDVDGYDLDHDVAFDRALDVQIEEDFICISEFTDGPDGDTHAFDAFWVLDTVTVTRYSDE